MPFSIRELQPTDASSLRSCLVALQEFERALDPHLRVGEQIADAYYMDMQERCAENDGAIYVAEVDGEIAGYVMVLASVPFEGLDDPPGEHAHVCDVFVHARHRGQGLGRALLARAEQYALSRGARELRISVLAANDRARGLYRAFGFVPHLETLSKRL